MAWPRARRSHGDHMEITWRSLAVGGACCVRAALAIPQDAISTRSHLRDQKALQNPSSHLGRSPDQSSAQPHPTASARSCKVVMCDMPCWRDMPCSGDMPCWRDMPCWPARVSGSYEPTVTNSRNPGCLPAPHAQAPARSGRRQSHANHMVTTCQSHSDPQSDHAPITRQSRANHAPITRQSRANHTPITCQSPARSG
jgi:hypothetical protein